MIGQVRPAPQLDRVHGIRDRFAEGGSVSDFVAVVMALAAILFLLYFCSMLWRRWHRHQTDNPRRLFVEVARQLPLSIPQRDLLRQLAKDLGLNHPTVLVLSPHIFQTHANRWMSATRRANQVTRQRLNELEQALFPNAGDHSS